MNTTSLLSVAVAMMLCTSTLALAQTASGTVNSTTGTTVDAGDTSVSGGTNAGANVDASADESGVAAGVDADADADAATSVDLDTDGDGTISEEETAAGAAAASAMGNIDSCSSVDLSTMAADDAQAGAVAAATSAVVIRLTDCEDGSTSALSAGVLDALTGNEAIMTVLGQESVSAGEVLSVSIDDTAATVYVRDDDDGEDEDDAATSAQ